jgi:hypothetical protein
MSGNCLPSITRTNKEGTIYVVADGGQGTASTFQYLRTEILDVVADAASDENTLHMESSDTGAFIGWSATAPNANDTKRIRINSSIINSIGNADPAGGFVMRPEVGSAVFLEFGGTTPNGILRLGSGVNDITALNATANLDTVLTNNLTTDDATVNFGLTADNISCINTLACEDLYSDNSIATFDLIINSFGDSNVITLNSSEDRLEVLNNALDTNTIAYTSDTGVGQFYLSTFLFLSSGSTEIPFTVAKSWNDSFISFTPGDKNFVVQQDGVYDLMFNAAVNNVNTSSATTTRTLTIDITRPGNPEYLGVLANSSYLPSNIIYNQTCDGIVELLSNDIINCRVVNTFTASPSTSFVVAEANEVDLNTWFTYNLIKKL